MPVRKQGGKLSYFKRNKNHPWACRRFGAKSRIVQWEGRYVWVTRSAVIWLSVACLFNLLSLFLSLPPTSNYWVSCFPSSSPSSFFFKRTRENSWYIRRKSLIDDIHDRKDFVNSLLLLVFLNRVRVAHNAPTLNPIVNRERSHVYENARLRSI